MTRGSFMDHLNWQLHALSPRFLNFFSFFSAQMCRFEANHTPGQRPNNPNISEYSMNACEPSRLVWLAAFKAMGTASQMAMPTLMLSLGCTIGAIFRPFSKKRNAAVCSGTWYSDRLFACAWPAQSAAVLRLRSQLQCNDSQKLCPLHCFEADSVERLFCDSTVFKKHFCKTWKNNYWTMDIRAKRPHPCLNWLSERLIYNAVAASSCTISAIFLHSSSAEDSIWNSEISELVWPFSATCLWRLEYQIPTRLITSRVFDCACAKAVLHSGGALRLNASLRDESGCLLIWNHFKDHFFVRSAKYWAECR